MRLKAHFFILSFFLIPLFGLFFSQQAFADTFTLSGNVQDSSGAVVGGATIHVFNTGTTTDVVSPTTSDTSTGNYNFSSVPSGTYDIYVTPQSGSSFAPIIVPSKTISSNT